MRCEERIIARALYVLCECNNRRCRLIQFKSVLQDHAINKPAVYSRVSQLRREDILQRFTRQRLVDVQQSRETPQHRIAVPVCRGDVVARTARSDSDKLFGVNRSSPGVQSSEKKIAV